MIPKIEGELISKALQVAELNKSAVRSVIDNDLDKLFSFLKEIGALKRWIKTTLIDHPVATIHDKKAQEILRKISSGEEMPADRMIKHMEEWTGQNLSYDGVFDGMDEKEIWDMGSEQFYSWFSHSEYIEGLFNISALILGVSVPSQLEKYVDQARTCYAFQQYLAVYSLSRTILETAIRDIGQRKGRLPRDKGNVSHLELRDFNHMKNKIVPRFIKGEVDNIYAVTSGLIHGGKTVNKDEAKDVFKRSLDVIQKLYDHYRL